MTSIKKAQVEPRRLEVAITDSASGREPATDDEAHRLEVRRWRTIELAALTTLEEARAKLATLASLDRVREPVGRLIVTELALRPRRVTGRGVPAARERGRPGRVQDERHGQGAVVHPRRRRRAVPHSGGGLMAKQVGVYPYETKQGTRWMWKADVNGVRNKGKGFVSQKAAAAARALWIARQHEGLGLTEGRGKTVEAFVAGDWLPRRKALVERGELRSSTVALNEADVRNHVLPTLGKRRLRDVTVEDVERLGDGLKLSPDSAKRVLNTLSLVFKLAVKYRHVPYNPVRDADKPKARRRQLDLPTLADVHRLADLAPTQVIRALTLTAAFTGIRKSEAFALRWPNVDLTEGAELALVVEQFYKGELVPSAKTEASDREIVLSPQAAAVLRELSVGYGFDDLPNPHGLVFPSPTGVRWRDSNFDRRVWSPMRDAAGLPGITFHVLRYFFVSTSAPRASRPRSRSS